MLASFLRCILGPRLIKIYASGGKNAVSYVPSQAEKLGDAFLKLMNLCLQLGIYTSPIVIWILYKRNYFSPEGLHTLVRFTAICTILCASSLAARAFGRLSKPEYVTFVNSLEAAKKNKGSVQTKTFLSRYDFDFYAWPVEYSAAELDADSNKSRLFLDQSKKNRSITELARALPCQIIGFLGSRTLGIRVLYPGTIIQYFIQPHLIDGRARLIEQHRGQRYKLVTQDGNSIDTIAVDRRGRSEFANGDILVICCEGNAGFYEVGMIGTPLEAGFSVLGWNHPGFGGSTGTPFPRQEQMAIDIVVQFALNKLKFPAERIVLYGWSIGGFSASWAAMNYPSVRAVMLDATFDNVLPLAINVMPSSWKPLVVSIVKNHMNLNVADQLVKYPGPILLFRRTRDEIIALEPGTLATNRGNDLLIKLLKFRFPYIIDSVTVPVLRQWLNAEASEREQFIRIHDVNSRFCVQKLREYIDEHTNSFPLFEFGLNWTEKKRCQMALFLANRYLLDFDSTHCTPLPVELFRSPQEIGLESDFVEVSDFLDIVPGDL